MLPLHHGGTVWQPLWLDEGQLPLMFKLCLICLWSKVGTVLQDLLGGFVRRNSRQSTGLEDD